jgi:hypothetical protein
MTKMEVTLELPGAPSGTTPAAESIRCIGVVVRQERRVETEGTPAYLTAIYFLEIDPEDRRKIADYVLNTMLKASS